MRTVWFLISGALVLTGMSSLHVLRAQSKPNVPNRWQPSAGQRQVAIWPHGAPDMEGVKQPAESVEVTKAPHTVANRPYASIENVSSPTMTVFPPKGRNTGAAIVVFPGGGFEILAIDLEGTEICDWITSRGMTCILSKYRVPKSDDQYDSKCRCHITPKIRRALQDAQRTIRLVRSQAGNLLVDPHKIGVSVSRRAAIW